MLLAIRLIPKEILFFAQVSLTLETYYYASRITLYSAYLKIC